ncbi:MAG: hypothetical protein A3J38_10620 [Gammaproteobacteria bacterium RIFCSPHIGHO2_12_FULL_45_9]|nr:MAG: hypothetical protein A3J38_10620 [Gammaproteobacteria bacterium RIFCSPHIGHO2_12_FULL_45_9]
MKTAPVFLSILVISAIALANMGSTLYLPALPVIQASLHTSAAWMKLTLSCYLIGFACSQLVYGPLSDAFGRRINLLFGLALFVIGTGISIAASHITTLLIGRLIEGLGIGAANVVGYALLRDVYQGHALTRQISYVSVFVGSMPIVAPVIGGYIVQYFNWQACFIVLGVLALGLVGAKLFYLSETLKVANPVAHHPAVAVKNYHILLRDISYLSFILCAALGLGDLLTMGSMLPFLMIQQLGIKPAVYGWLAGIPAIGYLSGAYWGGRFAARWGHVLVIQCAIWIGIVALLIGLVVTQVRFNVYTLLGPLVLCMVSAGVMVPVSSAGALTPFPQLAGAAAALLGLFMFGVSAIMTAVGSHLTEVTPAPLFTLLLIGLVIAGGVIMRLNYLTGGTSKRARQR